MAVQIERAALHDLRPGQLADFFAVLCERTRKSTRDGKPYYALRFRDRERTVSAPVWDNSPLFEACENQFQTGQHFKIRAIYQEHERYGPQIEIQNIRPATSEDWMDGYNPDDLVVSTRFDVEELFAELWAAAQSITDAPLRQLVVTLLEENKEQFMEYPAASKNHHAFRGGLLEHTVSVTRTGIYLADKYLQYYSDLQPPINKDLVIAGCILHDIGKLRELECGVEEIRYTVPGQLIGHILIGRDMVRSAAAEIKELAPELALYLEHIVLAHQGQPEWGSPKEPMLPEALLVHHADDIDAKMSIITGALRAAGSEGAFTDRNNVLRRKFLKERTV